MTQQRWKQIQDIFDSALDKPTADRNAFIDQTCAADASLRDEVLSLIRSFEGHKDFLEQPIAPLAFSEKPVDRMEGRMLGPYQLTRCIGKGGMGTVYAASRADKEYHKEVAIKLVRQGMDTDDILRRFRQERQVLAGLDHPNIARLLDGGTTEEGLPYLVMEFVEGVTLDRYAESKNLSINDRLKLFCTVCSAVQFAHQNLIVHRDLKPGNIIVGIDGSPKLLDFGIAKLLSPEFMTEGEELTRTDMRPMTPEYASPEQVRGEPITTASDVYALGVILYRLITGCTPYKFKSNTIIDIEKAILDEAPERPSVAVTRMDGKLPPEGVERARRTLSGDLDMIVLMALRKEPSRRYASAEKLADDIERYLNGLPVSAQNDTVRYRVDKFVRRHKAGVAAASLTAVALIAATIISINFARRANIEREVASSEREKAVSASVRAENERATAEKERTRAESEKSRAETESDRAIRRFKEVQQLAEFFLFDLDNALTAGETATRKAVIEKGLIYLNGLTQEAGGDLSLQRTIVRGYMKVGDLQGNLIRPNVGDAAAAKDTYKKAIRMAQDFAGATNSDLQSQLVLGQANSKLGEMYSLESNNSEALSYFKKAMAIYEPLAATDSQAQRQLAELLSRIGTVQEQQGDVDAAKRSFRRYLDLTSSMIPGAGEKSNSRRRLLAVAYLKYGRLLGRTGGREQAIDQLGRARKEFAALVAELPESAVLKRNLASTDNSIGDIFALNKQPQTAAGYFRNALKISEELALKDPRNQQNQRDLAATLGRLSAALAESGNKAEARQMIVREFSILKPMIEKQDPHSYDLYEYCWRLLTTEFKDIQNPALALQIAQTLVTRTRSESPEMLDLLARAQSATGDAAMAVKTEAKALAALPRTATSAMRSEFEKNLADFRAQAAKR